MASQPPTTYYPAVPPGTPAWSAFMPLSGPGPAPSADVWRIVDGDLADDEISDVVALALFTWRRAAPSDPVPEGASRHGWWAAPEGIGSRLWLLRSRTLTLTPETLRTAEDYAREALAFLVTDGVASKVSATASRAGLVLALSITIARPTAPDLVIRYDDVWSVLDA